MASKSGNPPNSSGRGSGPLLDLTKEEPQGSQSQPQFPTPGIPAPKRQSPSVRESPSDGTSYQDAVSSSPGAKRVRRKLQNELSSLNDGTGSSVVILQSRGREDIQVDPTLMADVGTVDAFLFFIRASMTDDVPSDTETVWLEDDRGRLTDERLAEALVSNRNFRLHRESDRGKPDGMVFESDEMYNIVPKAGILTRTCTQYTFYTAIAELVDNCLQAIWMEPEDKHRQIRITVTDTYVEIVDSGAGMDETQIKSWGTVGDSHNNLVHDRSRSVKPPFRIPYLGLYGVGAKAACLHLGQSATVESKRRRANQVAELKLEMSKLKNSEWLAAGRVDNDPDPSTLPFQGFTRVRITELNPEACIYDHARLEKFLKDVYHEYMTITDIDPDAIPEQQNQGAVTISLNGAELNDFEGQSELQATVFAGCFTEKEELQPLIIDVELTKKLIPSVNSPSGASTSSGVTEGETKARARIKCFYLPYKNGEEKLDEILEANPAPGVTFDNAWRTAYCWLCRWLPDANEPLLPFQRRPSGKISEARNAKLPPPQAMGRVRTIVYLDGGFTPSETKTKLATDAPFNRAISLLGETDATLSRTSAQGVKTAMTHVLHAGRGGRRGRGDQLTSAEKLKDCYYEWVRKQHELADDEVKSDLQNRKLVQYDNNLQIVLGGLDTQVVSFVKIIEMPTTGDANDTAPRVRGILNASAADGPKQLRAKEVKGCRYGTIEWFLFPGWEAPTDVRFVFRPHDWTKPDQRRSEVIEPTNVFCNFRSGKDCEFAHLKWLQTKKYVIVDAEEWAAMLHKEQTTLPGRVDILQEHEAAKVKEKAFPPDGTELEAGTDLPTASILVRPRGPIRGDRLARENIVQKDLKVGLDVLFTSTAGREDSFPHDDAQPWHKTKIPGPVYFFKFGPTKGKPYLHDVGTWRFTFKVNGNHNPPVEPLVRTVHVRACRTVGVWQMAERNKRVQVGVPLSVRITQKDIYQNASLFDANPPKLRHKFFTAELPHTPINDNKFDIVYRNVKVSADQKELEVGEIVVGAKLTPELRTVWLRLMPDSDAPKFQGVVSDQSEGKADDDKAEVCLSLRAGPACSEKCSWRSDPPLDGSVRLRPGHVFEDCVLTFQDKYGNPLEKGTVLDFDLDGFEIQSNRALRTDENGQINLSGMLKVSGDYGGTCNLAVSQHEIEVLSKEALVVDLAIQLKPEELTGLGGGDLDAAELTVVDADGQPVVDMEGSWTLVCNPKAKKPPGKTFEDGKAVLKEVVLPRKLGVVPAVLKVKLHKSGFQKVLEQKIDILLRAGDVAKLKPTALRSVTCGAPFKLCFTSTDVNDLETPLSESVCSQLCLTINSQPDVGSELTSLSARHVPESISEYEYEAQLEGVTGSYQLKLAVTETEASGDSEEAPPAMTSLSATWKMELRAGDMDTLEAVMDNSPVTTTKVVARGDPLDDVTLTALDSQENVSTQLDKVACVMEILPSGGSETSTWQAPHQTQWSEKVCKGVAVFKKPRITLPPGRYGVNFWFESASEKRLTFQIRVKEGNYPVDLILPDARELTVDLASESRAVLQTLFVDLISADGCKLRNRNKLAAPTLLVKLRDSGEVVGKRVAGKAADDAATVDAPASQDDVEAGPSDLQPPTERARDGTGVKAEGGPVKYEGESNGEPTRFVFKDVPVPTTAGEYTLEFSHTHEYELGSRRKDTKTCVRPLTVRHGLPSKLKFATSMRKNVGEGDNLVEAGGQLEVVVFDAHRNVCTTITGLRVRLYIATEAGGSGSENAPALVFSNGGSTASVEAVVVMGTANFGAVRMGSGKMGIYTFGCGLTASEVTGENVKEWKKEVGEAKSAFVFRNAEQEGQVWDEHTRLAEAPRLAKTQESALQERVRELDRETRGANARARDCAVACARTDATCARTRLQLTRLGTSYREAAQRIEELERAETAAALRNTPRVWDEFRRCRKWAAAAQTAVQTLGSGLHPDDFRRRGRDPEVLGVVAFLARVEDEVLNARLMEWIGGKKDSIVCRTSAGNAAFIDVRTPDGSVDIHRGLAAQAMRVHGAIPGGRYDVIPLDKPGVSRSFYKGSVDEKHPQKLLKLALPKINNDIVPEGFLGYAVNLLHLSPEQLEIHIRVPFGSGFQIYGLRASLLYHLFTDLQVYDTNAHKDAASRALQWPNFKAVTIGPGSISRPDREVSGFAPNSINGVCFERVPWAERKQCSLYPPDLGASLGTAEEFAQLQADEARQTAALQQEDAELRALEQSRADLGARAAALDQELKANAREIARLQAELKKLAATAHEYGINGRRESQAEAERQGNRQNSKRTRRS